MRDLVFRGKRLDNGEWVYGSLVNNEYLRRSSHPAIIYFGSDGHDACEVDADTVGQYTGLRDHNYKEIYEGDIIIIPEIKGVRIYVGFNEEIASFCLVEVPYYEDICCGITPLGEMLRKYNTAYVNGNIHDDSDFFKRFK